MAMMSRFTMIALLGIGVLCAPAFGANSGRPGTLNYIEGVAYLKDMQLTEKDVGSIELNAGETLTTQQGKAEILLTPGVFLRVGDHSSVKMISPDITLTKVELVQGRAGVEVDELYPQNDLRVIDGGVTTQLVKTGYYEFEAQPATAMVFKGKAAVEVGDGKYKVVKGHHEFALAEGAREKSVNFDAQGTEDELYNWSSLRSEYLSEANNQIAGNYAGVAGFNPGWYWDPYMYDYTFVGMGPFSSPFGFGFYPPWWGGYYGGGFYGRGFGGRGYRGGGYGGRGYRGGGYGGHGYGGVGRGGGGFGGGSHGGGGHR